jgi:hypothetical protein
VIFHKLLLEIFRVNKLAPLRLIVNVNDFFDSLAGVAIDPNVITISQIVLTPAKNVVFVRVYQSLPAIHHSIFVLAFKYAPFLADHPCKSIKYPFAIDLTEFTIKVTPTFNADLKILLNFIHFPF